MTVGEFYSKLDELYPRSLSCSWDNDGLLSCPDRNAEIKKVLVALDANEGAINAAIEAEAQLILTHHPMIFRGIKALDPSFVTAARAVSAYTNGIAVISLHTRLDAGKNGVNDALAARLGLEVCGTFGDDESPEIGRIAVTQRDMGIDEFAKSVADSLAADKVEYAGKRTVRNVAILGGAGSELILPAMLAGADTIVTGEVKYNNFLDMAESGINIVAAGHYFTEAPVCDVLAELARSICGAEVITYSSNIIKTV